jgi:hypothetical protein
MALLRMLNRAAFICNICFLLAVGILLFRHPVNPGLTSIIIVMGFIVSVVLNFTVNVWLIFLFIAKKPLSEIPRWLIFLNGGFLAVQLILIIK